MTNKTAIAVVLAVFAALLYVPVSNRLELFGVFRTITEVGTAGRKVLNLEGCEDFAYSHRHGLIYASCGNVERRRSWFPPMGRDDASTVEGASDGVYLISPRSGKFQRLEFQNYKLEFRAHGMDIYEDPAHNGTTYVFLVNHSPNIDRKEGDERASRSVVSIFKHKMGGPELEHVETIDSPLIRTPNDILAVNRRSFYVTNDHGFTVDSSLQKAARLFEDVLLLPLGNIIFRNDNLELVEVASGLNAANGMCRGQGKKILVASAAAGIVNVFERASDNSLKQVDSIQLPCSIDNPSYDEESNAIYVPAHCKVLSLLAASHSVSHNAPSSVYRITENESEGKYFGERYVTKLVYQEDGRKVSGSTAAIKIQKSDSLLVGGLYGKTAIVQLD
eukprot:TRINITY_DN2823_c0_g1_i1.p1 TRINITY_DN2823_c0_g1~~TRINITY_DN2823_c0_g1_i1.p1  ORF type:complete len:390 (+),score=114.77 TRINITY_DN2823_c0_g1_i1:42-1211(+)